MGSSVGGGKKRDVRYDVWRLNAKKSPNVGTQYCPVFTGYRSVMLASCLQHQLGSVKSG